MSYTSSYLSPRRLRCCHSTCDSKTLFKGSNSHIFSASSMRSLTLLRAFWWWFLCPSFGESRTITSAFTTSSVFRLLVPNWLFAFKNRKKENSSWRSYPAMRLSFVDGGSIGFLYGNRSSIFSKCEQPHIKPSPESVSRKLTFLKGKRPQGKPWNFFGTDNFINSWMVVLS